ncbi:putative nuclease HARBI1 [Lingula anatina]|uniref:Putative nuclease HARBI1 n=1 Tax=Lingula anatina TaxID=7574 RepID=A0A1S3HFQ5_LINAN|nr:putative nuclease HARBI1 [Lingula anatina]|eukprot:XP_013383869.1 putative nuclease HARBI1 [Lingula anatina]
MASSIVRRFDEFVAMSAEDANVAEGKRKFYTLAGFPHVIGCVDGTQIPIIAPNEREWEYVNRKGRHSINVQLICDADLRIINAVVRWPGSTHDSRILRESNVYEVMEQNPERGVILGDSGYPQLQWLMVPFYNPVTEGQREYNRVHMSTRSTIERCNGILKRRFSCLNTIRLIITPRACNVIMSTIALHNLCLRYRDIGNELELQPHEPEERANVLMV